MLIGRLRDILARRQNVRAHFWQTCANYTQQVSGLAIGVILARLLEPAAFGEFAYAMATVGLCLLPATWSLAPQIVSEYTTHPGIVSDALWISRRIFFARAALAALACAYLFFARGATACALGAIVALPQVGGEFIAVLRACLEGQGQFKVNFFDSVLTAAATALLSVPAAWFGAGTWALALPTIPLFLAQMVLFTRSSGRGIMPSQPRSDRSYARSGNALWLGSISEGALFRADKFLLGQYSTMSVLGDYNRAFNYAPLSARALNSLLTNPTVAGLSLAGSSTARAKLLVRASLLLLAGGAANFALWWWFADPLVPWIFGPQWAPAIPAFRAMAPMSLALSFAYLPTAAALARRDYNKLAFARTASLVTFLAAGLWWRHCLSATLIAWLLQAALALQGSILLLPGRQTRHESHA